LLIQQRTPKYLEFSTGVLHTTLFLLILKFSPMQRDLIATYFFSHWIPPASLSFLSTHSPHPRCYHPLSEPKPAQTVFLFVRYHAAVQPPHGWRGVPSPVLPGAPSCEWTGITSDDEGCCRTVGWVFSFGSVRVRSFERFQAHLAFQFACSSGLRSQARYIGKHGEERC
jgi:hypothetical protein